MATQTHFEWTATIEEGGILIMQNDVMITASVHDDGQVLIDDIELINGDLPKYAQGRNWPFLDHADERLSKLAELAKELLEDDEDFIAKAHKEAEATSRDYAEAEGDYRYEMMRDREMEGAE